MLICNADWEFLTVRQDIPVAFDELVALSTANDKAVRERSRYPNPQKPQAVAELDRLLAHTGVANLLKMSPPTILTLGNQCQCLER
jgi:hypothetical protein